jgi:hypothetical protein
MNLPPGQGLPRGALISPEAASEAGAMSLLHTWDRAVPCRTALGDHPRARIRIAAIAHDTLGIHATPESFDQTSQFAEFPERAVAVRNCERRHAVETTLACLLSDFGHADVSVCSGTSPFFNAKSRPIRKAFAIPSAYIAYPLMANSPTRPKPELPRIVAIISLQPLGNTWIIP